jgi:hypothetical protein
VSDPFGSGERDEPASPAAILAKQRVTIDATRAMNGELISLR